jgi:hypothetical protein
MIMMVTGQSLGQVLNLTLTLTTTITYTLNGYDGNRAESHTDAGY